MGKKNKEESNTLTYEYVSLIFFMFVTIVPLAFACFSGTLIHFILQLILLFQILYHSYLSLFAKTNEDHKLHFYIAGNLYFVNIILYFFCIACKITITKNHDILP